MPATRRTSASAPTTASNRLGAVFEVTGRTWEAEIEPTDEGLAPDGRVMEVLSSTLPGWLEGYLLTGRHGLFNCYEAFIHIIDSMFNQHAKWPKVTRDPVAAADRMLNYLPSSHVWRGPQRVLAPGSRLHRPRREQEAEVIRSTCRRTRTRSSPWPTTACAAGTT
jgi:phosphoketolase